jgi:diguanylate cyclase (GGDEF)-like protein
MSITHSATEIPATPEDDARLEPQTPKPAPAWLVLLTVVVGCLWLMWLFCAPGADGRRSLLTLTGPLILPTIVASAAGGWIAVRRIRNRAESTQMLCTLIARARSGQIPCEELGRVTGPLRELAAQIEDLLGELRQQRAETAALEAELPQRVANRTNALERKIGALRQQAVRDPLTGLFNRRLLDHHLPPLVAHCQKSTDNLALLMIDVDHFKKLNDTLGHAAGDDLLKSIAQIIRSTIRHGDLAFRCGGDEFVVVLPGFDAEGGQAVADRLISLVDGLARTLRVSPKPRLSIGIATFKNIKDCTPASLLSEADRLLYEEKRSRRGTLDREAAAAPPATGPRLASA